MISIIDKQYANDLAAGNIDMKNGNKQNSFPCLQMINVPVTKDKCTSDALNTDEETELDVTVTSIDNSWFSWRMPCFPVMYIEFTKAKIKINGKNFNGLVKRGLDISPGKVKCASYCQVKIDEVDYTVLWKFSNCQVELCEATAQAAAEPMPAPKESYESDTDTQHTLPFKVLGTCHSTCRQDALEEAYSYLNEYNRPVFVILEHEVDNAYDSNAIAVFVQTDYEYKKGTFALDRLGESTEVKDTVNYMAAKFLQATDEAIHEAKRRLHLADEIIHAAGCKTTTSSVETAIRSSSHSPLKSERRKALADAAAAKEQAEYEMIIAHKINERKQLEAKEEHRRLTEKAQYEHDVAILEAKKTEAIAKAKLDAIEQSITDDEIKSHRDRSHRPT
ncbi:Hypothetical predicted protein [Paramuricea clavata]|uniref:Uncharacterized protein n=1 Tax=Paramuricea clavata TaxID=317549 RepID=A0A6S7GVK6_PARCT|nr:Hypothetical predicted protein [Paramuricea clavata]